MIADWKSHDFTFRPIQKYLAREAVPKLIK